jgi:hypothetical protein
LSKPEESELGGPYLSVLYYSNRAEPLRWGLSYLTSIPAFVPKALYPGSKVPAISADFDQALYEGVGPVYGYGFNPVAEGVANFGLPGAFGAMVLWSLFFAWLSAYRYRGLMGMVLCANLLQETVNANRIDFRYVYLEFVYCGLAAVLSVLAVKAVSQIAYRRSSAVATMPSSIAVHASQRSNL